jgi:hypothetical protein
VNNDESIKQHHLQNIFLHSFALAIPCLMGEVYKAIQLDYDFYALSTWKDY